MNNKLHINNLLAADVEKLIESEYHTIIRSGINQLGGQVEKIKSICGTDGVIDGWLPFDGDQKILRVILETKLDESFNLAIVRSKVIAQVLGYLKKFDALGEQLPSIIFIGDRDECFVFHVNNVVEYIDGDYGWGRAPSNMYRDVELVDKLTRDKKLQEACFVFAIDECFDFMVVIEKIRDLIAGNRVRVRITENSVSKVFDYFTMRILKRKSSGASEYKPREQVGLFMSLVMYNDDCYLHPKKKGVAVFKDKEAKVDSDNFLSFTKHFMFVYNAVEKDKFASISDRLIQELERRFKGDFYTPTIWVDEAHKVIAKNLGETWKEDYMVWDCAWGTGNLTRDYKFKELYCSTLYDHDLNIGDRYHNDSFFGDKAVKFKYDFLNDDVDLFAELLGYVEKGYKLSEADFRGSILGRKAPDLVRGLLAGKKLLFFINPPFGTATNRDESSKKDIAQTRCNYLMKEENVGAISQQLYMQFIWRIIKIKRLFGSDIKIGLFSPTIWLTGGMGSKFRNDYRGSLSLLDGILFQASNFADVKDNWGIMFSVLDLSNTGDKFNYFKLKVMDFVGDNVTVVRNKIIYNLDFKKSLSEWIKVQGVGIDAPQMKSAISWNANRNVGRLYSNAMGYMVFGGNNVYQNSQMVTILSSCYNTGHGVSVMEDNFGKSVQAFAARRLITGKNSMWVNDKDEYMVPDIENPFYTQWENDCIVYSLFNTASNQSSLRGVFYNGKYWNVYNHFFFMSMRGMEDLALGSYSNDAVYSDLKNDNIGERFVYRKLQEVVLSADAKKVLDKAIELVKKSFKYRKVFNQEYPEYHINTWDAGWYQIKNMLKQYMPEDLKCFNEMYKELENRMRPLVVELGFLYDYPGYLSDLSYLEAACGSNEKSVIAKLKSIVDDRSMYEDEFQY